MSFQRWTPEEIETLREMRQRGCTAPIIAERLPGRTLNAIRQRAAILELPKLKRRWTEDEITFIKNTVDEVAEELCKQLERTRSAMEDQMIRALMRRSPDGRV